MRIVQVAIQPRLARAREDALKAWRRDEARRRKVPNAVVLPNPALQWLAAHDPRTHDDLRICEDLGPKRMARYGDALLDILAP